MPISGKIKWNKIVLQTAVSKAITKRGNLSSRTEKRIRDKAVVKLNQALRRFKNNLLNHPVSQEIDGGPEEQNLSGTLGGYGNLFSYIGFEDGSDPIGEVLALIDQHRLSSHKRVRKTGNVGKGRDRIGFEFSWKVVGMSKSKLFSSTRSTVPWMGKSWLKGIESGISGLGAYLYVEDENFKNSRSGTAVQVKNSLRSGGYRPVSYISALYNEFSRDLAGGKSGTSTPADTRGKLGRV
tara:strand:- start:4339 stop:5052 length:714 start_codon:yes stop_codon:yes gene_type:complete